MSMTTRFHGFTLIELLVTVMILSVLAMGALPVMQVTAQRIKENELRSSLRQLRDAIDAYKHAVDEGRIVKNADQSGYPPTLEILVEGVPDEKDAAKKKIRFLRRIPRDPMNADSELSAAETWGKRSYASEYDAPEEGADVYDVYSLSERQGVNGQPYASW
jgi:general secretion pathway protein G